MAFDVLVRALYVDSGAAAGLAKLNDGLDRVGKSGPGARSGLRLAETGLQRLAFEAAGLPGPLGRVAEGLLKIGGGGGLALLAAAAVGSLALAYNAATQSSRDAAKAQDEYLKSLEATGAAGKALEARITLRTEQDRLASMESRQSLATHLGNRLTGGLFTVGGFSPMEMEAQQSLVTKLTIAAGNAEGVATKAARERRKEIENQNEALAEQAYAMKELVRVSADLAQAQGFYMLNGLGATPGLVAQIPTYQRNQQIDAAGSKLLADEISTRLIGVGSGRTSDVVSGTPRTAGGVDSARLAAEAVALLGALRQGGAAGIFGALGGVATQLGGLKDSKGVNLLPSFVPGLGIGLNVVSGLFGMFDHSADRRQREMMDELRRIRQNTDKRGQPDRTSITIMLNGKEVSGALVDDVIYQINRMSRRDATPRLPSR